MNMAMRIRKVVVGIQEKLFTHNKISYINEKISTKHPNLCLELKPYSSIKGLDAEILITDPASLTKELEYLPKSIKWAQLSFAGVNELVKLINCNEDMKSMLEDVKVTRLGGVFGDLMKEYVIGAIISLERGFFQLREDQKKKIWRNSSSNKYIYGHRPFTQLSIGILGVGDIGMRIAKAVKGLGMTVYGLSTTSKDPNVVTKTFTVDLLPEMLQKCDYICNALPATSKTIDLLSNGILENCKDKCPAFINVGRGSIISNDDLLEALFKKWISSAFLDVFDQEPLPQESPLWNAENVYITPHVSGIGDFYEEVFLKNFEKYINNLELEYVVDFNKEY